MVSSILMIYMLVINLPLISEGVFYQTNFQDKSEELSNPTYSFDSSYKWWSVSFFGNVHKKICKKAYELINSQDYPDLLYYKSKILDGCGDEEGHRNSDNNGGDVKDIWYSVKNLNTNNNSRILGVMFHYKNLNWHEAYENIGVIIHLTQDQASPVHAANIKHSYFDQFERFYEADNNINITPIDIAIPPDLNPWDYYLFVQKSTRKKLKEWVDPETKIPYWQESKDALPLESDNTTGPYGQYGGGSDHFSKNVCENNYDGHNECKDVPKSPNIRNRQITLSILTTEKLLKNASKKLPPVLKLIKNDRDFIEFSVYDNRCKYLEYLIDGSKHGKWDLTTEFPYSKNVSMKKDFSFIIIKDCDGNEIKEKFN
ncbi:MAG: hypothetical protein N2Z20_00845 [Elusimicrobiales bacterium]|nr:hypothetical protein [Elusimicrobiales bacterium]